MSEMENVSQTNKNKENPHTDGQLSDVPAYSTDEKIPPPPQPQPQPLGVPQATSVATCKQQQPSTARRHTRRPAVPHSANTTYILSICWCVVCCLCGSPLTLACFIPAIYLSSTVHIAFINESEGQNSFIDDEYTG